MRESGRPQGDSNPCTRDENHGLERCESASNTVKTAESEPNDSPVETTRNNASSSERKHVREQFAEQAGKEPGDGRRRRGGLPKRPLAERFWSKVDVRGPDECWPWLAGRTDEGYGRFRIGGRGSPTTTAHRVAYEFTRGPIPPGMLGCHHCDNPPCCNPAHVFPGTTDDNARDCAEKGREKEQRGSRNAGTHLTESDVVQMRAAKAAGATLRQLTERYGVSKSTASYIVNGRTWTHVPMPVEQRGANDAEKVAS